MKFPELEPRRPYDEETYPGYVESDKDYVLNNLSLAVALLDAYDQGKLFTTEIEK